MDQPVRKFKHPFRMLLYFQQPLAIGNLVFGDPGSGQETGKRRQDRDDVQQVLPRKKGMQLAVTLQGKENMAGDRVNKEGGYGEENPYD
jgi:hypothetical protein